MSLFRDIYKRHEKLPKLVKRQIEEVSIGKRNCLYISYQLLKSSSTTTISRKNSDQLKFSSSYVSCRFLINCLSQVLQAPFLETIVTNSNFHLVKYHNWTKTVYIFPTYIEVPTNLTKLILFGVGWCDIWQKKYFSLFTVDYLNSSQDEVTKFASLSWHLSKA